jgi:hypothetical protein
MLSASRRLAAHRRGRAIARGALRLQEESASDVQGIDMKALSIFSVLF